MADTHINSNIDDADNEYNILIKKSTDIICELTGDINERLIYESIIDNLESTASQNIINNKVVQLPLIGCIRRSPLRQAMVDNYDNFKIARKNLTKEQYKEHVREVIIDAKQNLAKTDKDKLIIKRIRSRNKKRYDNLYINLGKAYAEMFILSILLLKEVPYNVEVQEHYDRLNNI